MPPKHRNYPIIVNFNTDLIYTGTTKTHTLTVKSTPTKITINPTTGYWNDTVTITATLTDTAPGHNNKPLQGKTIHFTIQGDPNTYHTITNATGTATLQYTITQNTGPYTITTTHDTDQIYTGTTNTTTLTVKSTPTKIVVSPVSGYNHDIVSLTASFKDTIHNKPLENKIIQFFVNNNPEGFATTTSDGIATLSYTINLAAGNYTIFAKFSGDDIYTTSNGTNNLNVILVVTSVNPANGTTTTNASQIITVTFNGLIESGSDYNTITVKNSAAPINQQNYQRNTIITPNQLPKRHTLNIPINSITDLAGNNLQNTYNSIFNIDATPPTITSINPTNGTTIPVNQTFTVTFNEQIKAGTNFNNIILWNNDLNILKPSTITINNNQLIITPTTKLMNAKYYSLIIPANSITDLAGNNLQNTYNSTYKTDGIPPIVTGINPLNNTKTHNTNQVITVFFKEPIKAGDAYNSITVKNYVGIDKDVNITIDTDQIIIIPLENYAPDMYILTIPVKAITDMAGNNLQNTVNVTFTVLI